MLRYLVTLLYIIGIVVILYKIKQKILLMIRNAEIEEVFGMNYIKSFNVFYVFVILNCIYLVAEAASIFLLFKMNKSDLVFFILFFIVCIFENSLYSITVLMFCYKKGSIKEIFKCNTAINRNNDTIIHLLTTE